VVVSTVCEIPPSLLFCWSSHGYDFAETSLRWVALFAVFRWRLFARLPIDRELRVLYYVDARSGVGEWATEQPEYLLVRCVTSFVEWFAVGGADGESESLRRQLCLLKPHACRTPPGSAEMSFLACWFGSCDMFVEAFFVFLGTWKYNC